MKTMAGVWAAGLAVGMAWAAEPAQRPADGGIAALRETGRAFTEVARTAMPAVVFVRVEKTVAMGSRGLPPGYYNDPFGFFGDDFLERFFGGHGRRTPPSFRQVGQGSGFLISKDGYILTNNHVVGDAERIVVRLHDGREFEAKRVGADPRSEVALIRIEADNLPFLPVADSSALMIGEWVIAIGNPFGLSETLTVGVVSAKGRSDLGVAEFEDFIQTDAAINPGNSGGPLLNIDGKAVGINTAIYSGGGGSVGIGFAIPINTAMSVRDQLVRHGKVLHGFLGVELNPEDVTEDLARSFGLKRTTGVLVADVIGGSPAQKAGLRSGDIILRVNGREVRSNGEFRNLVAMLAPETEVRLDVHRDEKELTVRAKVGVLPGDEDNPREAAALLERLGVSVAELDPAVARRFGYGEGEGVLVDGVQPDGPAAEAGLRPGYLIVSVNREPVGDLSALHKSLVKAARDNRILLRVRNARYTWYVLLRLE